MIKLLEGGPTFSEDAWDEEDYNLWSLLPGKGRNSTRLYMQLMYSLIRANGCKWLVELGCYLGLTSSVLALAAKKNEGHLWVFDNGSAQPEGKHPLQHADERLQNLGLTKWVTLTDCPSTHAPAAGGFDFVFVDADHSYEGVSKDWEAWNGRVKVGGFMAFHDLMDPEGVSRWAHDTFPRQGWEYLALPGDCGLLLCRKVDM